MSPRPFGSSTCGSTPPTTSLRFSTAPMRSLDLLKTHCAAATFPIEFLAGFPSTNATEVKDLMAYVRLTVNPKDEEAFRRCDQFARPGNWETPPSPD